MGGPSLTIVTSYILMASEKCPATNEASSATPRGPRTLPQRSSSPRVSFAILVAGLLAVVVAEVVWSCGLVGPPPWVPIAYLHMGNVGIFECHERIRKRTDTAVSFTP